MTDSANTAAEAHCQHSVIIGDCGALLRFTLIWKSG